MNQYYPERGTVNYRFFKAAVLSFLLAGSALTTLAQTATPFGLEDNQIGTWAGTSSSETAVINSTAADVRTGAYSLKLSTTSTGTGSKQWFSNSPAATSGSGIYVYFVYWAKALTAGTSADASLRYSSTTPPTGSGSSANASADIALSTTAWTRVVNSLTTTSVRYYFPGPRKTVSTGATSWLIDDGIVYTSSVATVDTTDPLTPGIPTASVSGSLVNLSWTSNTDAGTGVTATIILRNNNTSAAPPVFNDQAEYSVAGGSTGPNNPGGWTVVSTTVGGTATTYMDASAAPGNYKYAVVLRDLAYNYSTAAVSSTVTVGTPVPTIFTSQTGFTGNMGTIVRGSASAVQQYSISGFNLSNAISVTAPTGFEVSASATSGFANAITIPHTSGTVASTNVYVRYAPLLASGFSGTLNIDHTSTGATLKSVPVSGTAIDVEPSTSGTISFGIVNNTAIQVNLPTPGNGTNRIIVISKEQDVSFAPTDGVPVAGVNADFSLATDQGSGDRVVYDGTGSGNVVVNVTGLAPATTFYFAVYEYNMGTGTSQNYITVSPLIAIAKTALFNVGVGSSLVAGNGSMLIFPNPSQGRIHIESPVPVLLSVRDMTGRLLYRQVQSKEADLRSLADGVYIITGHDEQGRVLMNQYLTIQH